MEIKEESYLPPWEVLQRYPTHLPIIFLGGPKGHAILATSFSKASMGEVLDTKFALSQEHSAFDLPFTEGYVGVIPYHDFSNQESSEQLFKCYRVYSCLIFDLDKRLLYRCQGKKKGSYSHIDIDTLLSSKQKSLHPKAEKFFDLKPDKDKHAYQTMIEEAIHQIRSGRYYQINLLKYFQISQKISRSDILLKLEKKGGPYSACFDFEDFHLTSFSPEQFLAIEKTDQGFQVSTSPIKGTMPRSKNPEQDKYYYKTLQNSKKDHAELHIIVDLMRNDLQKISNKGSVRVDSPGSIHSFPTVHHLIANIKGDLKPGLSLRDVLASTSPGGSITGAPKKEVMKAIFEFEQRNRDYFMGHCFFWDLNTKRFDSSILIRTLVAKDGKHFEYAAGSGITVSSDPIQEYSEIADKCKVVAEI